MTNENDRKDENQLRKGDGRVLLKVVGRAAESLLWGLAFSVSAGIPVWSGLHWSGGNLGPIVFAVAGVTLLIFTIPAFIIGLVLGLYSYHGWPYRVGLVVLCVILWAYLESKFESRGREFFWWLG